jgi:hypothetical protein
MAEAFAFLQEVQGLETIPDINDKPKLQVRTDTMYTVPCENSSSQLSNRTKVHGDEDSMAKAKQMVAKRNLEKC